MNGLLITFHNDILFCTLLSVTLIYSIPIYCCANKLTGKKRVVRVNDTKMMNQNSKNFVHHWCPKIGQFIGCIIQNQILRVKHPCCFKTASVP
jgi:hypothetical protein